MFSKYLGRRKRNQLKMEFAPGVDKSKLHRVFVSNQIEEIDGVRRNLEHQEFELYRQFSAGLFSDRGRATCLYLQGKRLSQTEDNFHNYLKTQNIEQKLPENLVEIIRNDDRRCFVVPGKDFQSDDFLAIFRYGNDTKIRLVRSRMMSWFNLTKDTQRNLNKHMLAFGKRMAFNRKLGLEWQGPFNGWPTSEVEIAAEVLSAGSWADSSRPAFFDLADLDTDLYQTCFAFDDTEFFERYR